MNEPRHGERHTSAKGSEDSTLHTYRVPRFLRERDQVELFHQGEEDSSGPELVGETKETHVLPQNTVYGVCM